MTLKTRSLKPWKISKAFPAPCPSLLTSFPTERGTERIEGPVHLSTECRKQAKGKPWAHHSNWTVTSPILPGISLTLGHSLLLGGAGAIAAQVHGDQPHHLQDSSTFSPRGHALPFPIRNRELTALSKVPDNGCLTLHTSQMK